MHTSLEILSDLLPAREHLFLAKVDGFWIFVAVMVISAISNWFQKRNQPATDDAHSDEEDGHHPHTQAPPVISSPAPPPKTVDWEEEMRRILSGEPAHTTPVPPPPPPLPPIVVQIPHPAPMPPPLPVEPAHRPPPYHIPDLVASPPPRLAKMEESADAYGRAQQLQERVHERMLQVDQLTVKHPVAPATVHHQDATAVGSAAIAMLRYRASARQAMVASFILGPPRGLE